MEAGIGCTFIGNPKVVALYVSLLTAVCSCNHVYFMGRYVVRYFN